jgi:hypothetical protein
MVRAWSMFPRYKCCSTISCGKVHVVPFGSTWGFSAHAVRLTMPDCGVMANANENKRRRRELRDCGIPFFSLCSTTAKPPTTPLAAS